MKTLARIVLFPGSILAIVALSCLPSNAAPIFSFYTGDPNVLNSGVTNIINPTGVSGFNSGNPYFSNLYQSFTVVPGGGWTVEEVFSNDAVDFSTAQAEWEIQKWDEQQGMAALWWRPGHERGDPNLDGPCSIEWSDDLHHRGERA